MRGQSGSTGLDEARHRRARHWALLVALGLLISSLGCLWGGTSAVPTRASSVNLSQRELDYFFEVALGVEYGTSAAEVKKWRKDPRVKLFGKPTDADRETVQQVVDELNNLQGQIALRVVNQGPNIEIHFVPESEFAGIEPNYRPTNYGFFWTW
jgi:hypothetical protein